MKSSNKITSLNLPMIEPLPEETQKYFDICQEKLGLVPNVLKAFAFDINKLNSFICMYNDLMLSEGGLSKLDREMIAVTVSSINKCFYCLTAHGAAIRQISGDPKLGEMIAMHYKVAPLTKKQRVMLDFVKKITCESADIEEPDRQLLRDYGFNDRDIWDIANVTAFFNMTNRLSSAVDMRPNDAYHRQNR